MGVMVGVDTWNWFVQFLQVLARMIVTTPFWPGILEAKCWNDAYLDEKE